MKRILHIQKVTGIAGSENHLLTLLPRLDRHKFNVTFLILTEPDKPLKEYFVLLREKGIKTHQMLVRRDIDPFCLLTIYRFLKKESFDLVHTHLIHADLYGTLAAKLAGIPHIVSTKHNDNAFRTNMFMKALVRIANRRCKRVITISYHLADFAQRVEGVPAEHVVPIHYGLFPYNDRPGDWRKIREEFAVPASATLVLSIGRLTEQKGHRYLLEAWRTIASVDPAVRLLLIGDGPLRNRLPAYARNIGLGDRAIFTGWRNDVPDLLDAADIYVHPSLWEGFGLVLLEAMATGKPVIASNVSAIPEVVINGETGILVPPRDSKALADAICRLLEDVEFRRKMGGAGRRRVEEVFSVERMVRETERVYEDVFGRSEQH